VKWINRISVLLLGIIFLLSATGIVVYQTHCSCTGYEHVSLYVSPETCEDNFHTHHMHQKGGEVVPSEKGKCHECASHTKDCGCNDMNMSYFKLKNEVVHEKGRSETKLPLRFIQPEFVIVLVSVISNESPKIDYNYIEPPSDKTSLDFLIRIHQLKIPHLA
jgi:hypothetical protein